MQIETPRLILRELQESDASERYLAWMRDPDALKYISSAASTQALADLRDYIRARSGREDVLFLGIFDRQSGAHIGNMKYEPVDSNSGDAIMGILIGEPVFRGRGVTAEALNASAAWLKEHRRIRRIVLGVRRDNEAAIRAYERAGFTVSDTQLIAPGSQEALTMTREL